MTQISATYGRTDRRTDKMGVACPVLEVERIATRGEDVINITAIGSFVRSVHMTSFTEYTMFRVYRPVYFKESR